MREDHADAAPAHDPPPAEPDYYAALGVTPAASADEVRRAYHRLAKLWHPDRFMHAPESLRERAGRRMRTLTAAYAVLGNAAERRAYDARRVPDAGDDAQHGAVPLVFQRDASVWAGPLGFGATAGQTMGRRGTPEGGQLFFGLLAGTVLLLVTYYALRNNGSQSGGILAFGVVLLLFIVVIWALASSGGGQVAAPATKPANHAAAAMEAPEAPDIPGAPERTAFERMVDDALADVPERFRPFLDNVVVQVEPEPTAEDLATVGVREGGLLLGLYRGVNLTRQSVFHLAGGPEEITIFQRPIEQYCHGDPERIRHQVLATVLHELAHHFGLEHEDMPEWVK